MKTKIVRNTLTAVNLLAALSIAVCAVVQGSTAQQTPPQHHTYQLIDLGTLGGPSSYQSVNGPQDQIINDAGVVGFTADTAVADPNAPNCFWPDCFLSHGTRWENGVLTDLGALPGYGNSSGSAGINARGWITGQSENGEIDPFSGLPEVRSVLWRNGEVIDLGTFGGNWSIPLTLNDAGVVVGFASNTIPYPSALFPPSATQTRAYIWQNGVLTDLGTLGGPEANAFSINQSGQIAGISFTSYIPDPTTGIPPLHAVLWYRDNMIDLGTLGGTYSGTGSCAFAAAPCIGPPWVEEGTLLVNNRGQVMGTSNLAGDQVFHPFLWQRGTMRDLGTLGGDNGTALWLTDQGEVVGQADVPKSPPGCEGATCIHHAFLWKKGVMSDLGTVATDACSRALMSNERGQIVGVSIHVCGSGSGDNPLNHAFLWENGGPMVDLNTLIPANSGVYLYEGNKINSRGEIVSRGLPAGCSDSNACGRVYLLVPSS
jgi:probable HAF family extracellular repeat protein